MADAKPTLAELVERALESRLADVHVSMPGIVVAYDAATQTADVQPALRRVVLSTDDDPIAEDLPILRNVPVSFPGGAGFTIHFTLAAGDSGDLIFSSMSHNEWQASGDVSTPGNLRPHDLASAKFYPGIRSKKNAAPDTDASIGIPGGLRAHFGSASIDVGSGGQFVALAGLVLAELNKIAATLATGSNGGGPVVFATPYTASPVAASNLKADP